MIVGDSRRPFVAAGHAETHDLNLPHKMSMSSNRLPEPWEILRHLHRGSSEIDWCEENYTVSSTIAEFVNTLSNILFLVIPPLLIVLFQQYAKNAETKSIFVIWCLLIGVGLASAYFHATLSFAGQMLDELAILWLICAGFSLWLPSRFLPSQMNRYVFKWTMFVVTLVGTFLACIRPVVNAFALMGFGIPISVMLIVEMRRCQDQKIRRLGVRTCVLFGTAVFCWVNDRMMCDVWTKWSFPYLHGLWHILVFLASYACCVLFAFFDAEEVAPKFTPRLRYWPVDTFEFGIPYVTLTSRSKGARPKDM